MEYAGGAGESACVSDSSAPGGLQVLRARRSEVAARSILQCTKLLYQCCLPLERQGSSLYENELLTKLTSEVNLPGYIQDGLCFKFDVPISSLHLVCSYQTMFSLYTSSLLHL